MNVFMEGFHDALHLYALALHDIMKNGSEKKDGKQITQNMWNRTFEGMMLCKNASFVLPSR